jgi:hypothetical protein
MEYVSSSKTRLRPELFWVNMATAKNSIWMSRELVGAHLVGLFEPGSFCGTSNAGATAHAGQVRLYLLPCVIVRCHC